MKKSYADTLRGASQEKKEKISSRAKKHFKRLLAVKKAEMKSSGQGQSTDLRVQAIESKYLETQAEVLVAEEYNAYELLSEKLLRFSEAHQALVKKQLSVHGFSCVPQLLLKLAKRVDRWAPEITLKNVENELCKTLGEQYSFSTIVWSYLDTLVSERDFDRLWAQLASTHYRNSSHNLFQLYKALDRILAAVSQADLCTLQMATTVQQRLFTLFGSSSKKAVAKDPKTKREYAAFKKKVASQKSEEFSGESSTQACQ